MLFACSICLIRVMGGFGWSVCCFFFCQGVSLVRVWRSQSFIQGVYLGEDIYHLFSPVLPRCPLGGLTSVKVSWRHIWLHVRTDLYEYQSIFATFRLHFAPTTFLSAMAFSEEQLKVVQTMISDVLQGDVFHSVVEEAATRTAEFFLSKGKFIYGVSEVFDRAIADGDDFRGAVAKCVQQSLQPGARCASLAVMEASLPGTFVPSPMKTSRLLCLKVVLWLLWWRSAAWQRPVPRAIENLMEPILFPSMEIEKKFPFLVQRKDYGA